MIKWIQPDFPNYQGGPHRFTNPSIIDSPWPKVEELQDQTGLSKRRKHNSQPWCDLSSAGHGMLHGTVVRIHRIPRKTLLYIKEGQSIGVVVVQQKPISSSPSRSPLIGDFVSLRIVEFRPIECVPQIDQAICSHFPVGIAADFIIDDSNYPEVVVEPASLPWELDNFPEFVTLENATEAKIQSSIRLKLTVVKIAPLLNDNGVLYAIQAMCHDQVGGTCCCKLSADTVNIDLIKTDKIIVLTGAKVVKFESLHSVYIKQSTLVEILPSNLDSHVPEMGPSGSCHLSIKAAMLKADSVPDGCDDVIQVSGRLTALSLKSSHSEGSTVTAICPKCQERFPVSFRGNVKCPKCGREEEGSIESWKLYFSYCLIALSDDSGTWKGLFLNGKIVEQFLKLSPQEYLALSEAEREKVRFAMLFASFRLSIKVHKTAKPQVKVYEMEREERI